MSTKSKLTALVASSLICSLAGLAQASTDLAETKSVVVTYGDLDLTREADQATLHARLRSAARRVCGRLTPGDAEDRYEWQLCYDAALTKAIGQLASERLAAAGR